MIKTDGLTKRYGDKVAVEHLSFEVLPGRVTGFLGPNGAGKSTTMRLILGLDRPNEGTSAINGTAYADLPVPLREVGSLLEAKAAHGGRRARDHLLCLALSNRIPAARVDAVLELVGLTEAADERISGFSLGMGQRLGIAAALLGDPGILIFDEPANGLDTQGIRWFRGLARDLAAEGRTVFLSSHLMSEMEMTADHLIVIGQGRLLADMPAREFIEHNSKAVTLVRSPQAGVLRQLLEDRGAKVGLDPSGAWRVEGLDPAGVGDLAAAHEITLHELASKFSSLEEVYTDMTQTSVEYHGGNR